jgi:hypothetical protein
MKMLSLVSQVDVCILDGVATEGKVSLNEAWPIVSLRATCGRNRGGMPVTLPAHGRSLDAEDGLVVLDEESPESPPVTSRSLPWGIMVVAAEEMLECSRLFSS